MPSGGTKETDQVCFQHRDAPQIWVAVGHIIYCVAACILLVKDFCGMVALILLVLIVLIVKSSQISCSVFAWLFVPPRLSHLYTFTPCTTAAEKTRAQKVQSDTMSGHKAARWWLE